MNNAHDELDDIFDAIGVTGPERVTTEFSDDMLIGDKAVHYFIDVLDKRGIKYLDATPKQQDQEIDIITKRGTYEIKYQKDPNTVCIEDDDGLGRGWVYYSKADYLLEINPKHKVIVEFDMVQLRQAYLHDIKDKYTLFKNKQTNGLYGDVWKGSFRMVPTNYLLKLVTKSRIIYV